MFESMKSLDHPMNALADINVVLLEMQQREIFCSRINFLAKMKTITMQSMTVDKHSFILFYYIVTRSFDVCKQSPHLYSYVVVKISIKNGLFVRWISKNCLKFDHDFSRMIAR